VLDVGSGTGRLAAVLADKYGCKVWGVDITPDMVDVASERVPRGVRVKVGAAESLPFRDGWFERVTSTLAVHLVERAPAFTEARRVLGAGGRYVILTFDPSYFPGYYLNRFFPSFLEIDAARFPPADVFDHELRTAGFQSVRVVRHHQERSLDREAALTRIRGRHISTFQLISEREYDLGLAQAERELPDVVTYDERWLVVVAER
jgi:SAM-dependent methyltransferase